MKEEGEEYVHVLDVAYHEEEWVHVYGYIWEILAKVLGRYNGPIGVPGPAA